MRSTEFRHATSTVLGSFHSWSAGRFSAVSELNGTDQDPIDQIAKSIGRFFALVSTRAIAFPIMSIGWILTLLSLRVITAFEPAGISGNAIHGAGFVIRISIAALFLIPAIALWHGGTAMWEWFS